MQQETVLAAAYEMVLALGQKPTRRSVNDVIIKVTGKGFRAKIVSEFLRGLRNDDDSLLKAAIDELESSPCFSAPPGWAVK